MSIPSYISFTRLLSSKSGAWFLLLILSATISIPLKLMGLPAVFLMGPMAAAAIIGMHGSSIRVSGTLYTASLGIIGCMMAKLISVSVIASFSREWPVLLLVTVSIVAFSFLLGWLISRFQLLPGTTGIWGAAPGAASAMVVMAQDFGADARLVAVMQYLRVFVVVAIASLIAQFWLHLHGGSMAKPFWVLSNPYDVVLTVVIGVGAAMLGEKLRIPSRKLLLPFLFAFTFQRLPGMNLELPPYLIAVSLAILGWNIGLSFTRESIQHAVRSLPVMLTSIFLLVLFCAGLAVLLSRTMGIDLLTAYLATNPGGLDAAAIIGASANVDMSFVMLLQTSRLIFVIFAGPIVARIMARRHLMKTNLAIEKGLTTESTG